MVSREIRRRALALALVSSCALLAPLAAQPRSLRSAGTPRAAEGAPWERAWSATLPFWHFLTSLWGNSGAKIDGNG